MTYVYGIGSSPFAKQPERGYAALAHEAVGEALGDARLDATDLDAVFVGTVFGEPGIAQRALHGMGIVDVPIVTVENACASGTTAFHEAAEAVRLGRYDRVLVAGIETLTSRFAGALPSSPNDPEGATGMALPAIYAMCASRYLHEGWVTQEQLAQVSVKNHRHALLNDRAQYRGEYSVDDVLASRPIADPLTLLQCSPLSDACAAVIVGRERRESRDVRIAATALASGGPWDHGSPHVWGFALVRDVARNAYEAAGVGPADVDVLEVHDAFTIGEIVATEALGLTAEGRGGELVEAGHTALGGRQPVNPSGGLLSRGHPLGATGVAQVAEIVAQLRGEAGRRQVLGARVGLVETMGGGVSGIDGNAGAAVVLGDA